MARVHEVQGAQAQGRNMKDWLEEHGTPALRRAYQEGYAVDRGIAEEILGRLSDSISLQTVRKWQDVGERTSPRADAFAKRDLIVDVARRLALPRKWTLEVSKISRVTEREGQHFTGVVLDVRDENRKHLHRLAVNFEKSVR